MVQKLARLGAFIRVAVRNQSNARFLKPLGDVGQITPLYADIKNIKDVFAACSGRCDIVINLVGILLEEGNQTFTNVHVIGASNISKVVRSLNIKRFIHISAVGAINNSLSMYSKSKAEGESYEGIHLPYIKSAFLGRSLSDSNSHGSSAALY